MEVHNLRWWKKQLQITVLLKNGFYCCRHQLNAYQRNKQSFSFSFSSILFFAAIKIIIRHFYRSWIISLQLSTPIFFKSFSTTSNHLFLDHPRDLFPDGFQVNAALAVLSSFLRIISKPLYPLTFELELFLSHPASRY